MICKDSNDCLVIAKNYYSKEGKTPFTCDMSHVTNYTYGSYGRTNLENNTQVVEGKTVNMFFTDNYKSILSKCRY